MDNRPIGVFDSGLGGLTVVREMERLMPNENVVYFGDTARVPYGSKSKEKIIEFSHQIMHFLLSKNVKAVIIACGTASSNALEEMKKSYDIPIIGVVEPGARQARSLTRNGRIGVLGTSATIRSGAFERLLRKDQEQTEKTSSLEVFSQPCPLFVPLVEEGWFEDDVTRQVIKRYVQPLKEADVDTLILGCTHYPLLWDLIQEEMGNGVRLINVSAAAVEEMKTHLKETAFQAEEGLGHYEFYASDSVHQFKNFCSKILELDELSVEKINIEKYGS